MTNGDAAGDVGGDDDDDDDDDKEMPMTRAMNQTPFMLQW